MIVPRYIIIYTLFLYGSCCYAQGINTGNPRIKNYTVNAKNSRFTGSQFWAIDQDANGRLYFGNGSGVIVYDGVQWEVVKTSNNSTVRSINTDPSTQLVYVGAQDDFGYLDVDSRGRLIFQSLAKLLPDSEKKFGDVWKTYSTKVGIVFQTFSHLFIWNGSSIKVIKAPFAFHFSFMVSDQYYVNDNVNGIMLLKGDSLISIPGGDYFAGKRVQSMLPLDHSSILISTRNDGLFKYSDGEIIEFAKDSYSAWEDAQIYHGTQLNDGTIVLGSLRSGLFQFNRSGKLLKWITKECGLQDERIHSVFEDKSLGVWAATNDGLSRIELSAPMSYYGKQQGLKGKIQAICRHKETLFIGSSYGLYYMNKDKGYQPSNFTVIPEITTSVWQFLSLEQGLLVATSQGLYNIKDNEVEEIIQGYIIVLSDSEMDPNRVYVGTLDGAFALEFKNNQWNTGPIISGSNGIIRGIEEVDGHTLWVTVHNRGVMKIDLSEGYNPANLRYKRFTEEHGLSSTGRIIPYETVTGLIFGTNKGYYRFDNEKEQFYPDTILGVKYEAFKDESYRLRQDAMGTLWRGVINDPIEKGTLLDDGTYAWNEIPFLTIPVHRVKEIYPEENGVVWIGTIDGLIQYIDNQEYDYSTDFPALITNVNVIQNDSSLFQGYKSSASTMPLGIPEIEFEMNSIRFEFAAPSYPNEGNVLYQYMLEGFDEKWSNWTYENKKEYTNLYEGDYKFKVKAKNIYKSISAVSSYDFRVISPWYRTWWALSLWIGLPSILLLIGYKWRVSNLKKQRASLKEVIEARTSMLDRKSRENEILYRVSSELIAQDDFQSLLNIIIEAAVNIFSNAEKGSIFLLNEETNLIECKAVYGYPESLINDIKLQVGEGQAGIAVKEQRSFIVNNLDEYATFTQNVPNWKPIKSMMQVLLHVGGKTLGTLSLDNLTESSAFTEDDLRILKSFASNASIVIERTRTKRELEERKEKLESLNREKDAMINIVAHDLRAPFNKIKGLVSLMSMDGKLNKQQRTDMALIEQVIHQGDNLIRDLLDAQSFEHTNKNDLNLEEISMGEFIPTFTKSYEQQLGKKDQCLNTKIEPADISIVTEVTYLSRVLDNLMTNAIKFSKNGQKIDLSVMEQNGNVLFSVRDKGPGINDHDKKKLFKSFQRLSAQPTGGESSNGLGLSIVKKLVDKLNGEIEVKSEIDKGTEFVISIPKKST